MGSKLIKKIIIIILYFLAIGLFFSVACMPFAIFNEIMDKLNHGLRAIHFIVAALNIVYLVGYLVVIIMLIKIINSTNSSPFIISNVKRFRVMGVFLTINTIYECVRGYSVNENAMIKIMGTANGAISPIMVIGVISALMCFVMAEVFKKAIEIKSDNDLTI